MGAHFITGVMYRVKHPWLRRVVRYLAGWRKVGPHTYELRKHGGLWIERTTDGVVTLTYPLQPFEIDDLPSQDSLTEYAINPSALNHRPRT